MPDIVEISEKMNESIIMYRWAFGGKAETLDELRANFAPGQDKFAYLVGSKDAYAWDEDAADFVLVGQWQGPVGPAGLGLPPGGVKGQALVKSSNGDFESGWGDLTLKTTAPLSGGGQITNGLTLNIADATETTRGIVRLATYAEVIAGTHDNLVISTVRLKEQLETIRAEIEAINSMPVGTVFMFAAETPPDGALVGNGALAPIEDFSDLFSVVGYAHSPEGEIPPSGYFYLPNYMDYFLRGHNPVSGRKFGSEQGWAIENIKGTLRDSVFSTASPSDTALFSVSSNSVVGSGASGTNKKNFTFDASKVVATANETRPMNKTVLICIKY